MYSVKEYIMKKYYPFKDKEELLETIEYLKDKLNNATTNDDKFYLNMRIKSLEELLNQDLRN